RAMSVVGALNDRRRRSWLPAECGRRLRRIPGGGDRRHARSDARARPPGPPTGGHLQLLPVLRRPGGTHLLADVQLAGGHRFINCMSISSLMVLSPEAGAAGGGDLRGPFSVDVSPRR